MIDTRAFPHERKMSNSTTNYGGAVSSDILTPSQFADLYEYLCCATTFVGFSAVPWAELGMCDVLEEPTDEPEGLRIYLRKGQPVAVMEYDVGYRLVQKWQK
jgi:hypothetical protein